MQTIAPDVTTIATALDEPETASLLRDRLTNRSAVIGIIGLGYVGLPLVLAAAEAAFASLGFDIDAAKVDDAERRPQPTSGTYRRRRDRRACVAAGRLRRHRRLRPRSPRPTRMLICVPTPLTRHREPDLVLSSQAPPSDRRRTCAPGQLVVLEIDHLSRHHARDGAADPRGGRAAVAAATSSSPTRPSARIRATPISRTGTIPKVVGGDGPTALRPGQRALRRHRRAHRAGVVDRTPPRR